MKRVAVLCSLAAIRVGLVAALIGVALVVLDVRTRRHAPVPPSAFCDQVIDAFMAAGSPMGNQEDWLQHFYFKGRADHARKCLAEFDEDPSWLSDDVKTLVPFHPSNRE